MFNDGRSKRVIFVAHCVLNQNAKIDRCARYQGAMREVAECLVASGVGIVQMPCPELMCLGLDREAGRQSGAQEACRRMADDVARQVEQYRANGFDVAGIIGINGSPTCGVETNWGEDVEAPGRGVFLECIEQRLRRDGAEVRMRGVKAGDPRQAVAATAELLTTAG